MVHIESMEGQSQRARREERIRLQMSELATVAASHGWPTFRQLCFENAERLERRILDASAMDDQRVMDRAIGKAAAYREIPALVERKARELIRAREAADRERAAQTDGEQT